MRFKLLTLIVVASCLPAAAQSLGPRLQSVVQGNGVTIGGRAHVLRGAEGTYIDIENPGLTRSISGFIPFGDEPTFPGLSDLDGRNVEITGVVYSDGRAMILMNDPGQLRIMASNRP
jgi:hypothetical protein